MPTYYADFDLGTGNNTGVSWTHAWKTMADAIAGTGGTAPTAGDTVYCRGTDTVAAAPTITQVGTQAAGMVKWIGVNSSGNNDGTRAVLDANENNVAACVCNGNYNYFENFDFRNSGNSDGFNGTGDYLVFVNCCFYSNALDGFNGEASGSATLIRCVSYGNGSDGYRAVASTRFLFCCSHDNTAHGFNCGTSTDQVLIGCIAWDNLDGINSPAKGLIYNCVLDSNTSDGISIASSATDGISVVIGNRITTNTTSGLDCNSEIVIRGWNFYEDNGAGAGDHVIDDTVAISLIHNGTATDDDDANADTNQGYTNVGEGSEDFNLASDASLRRQAITIPTS